MSFKTLLKMRTPRPVLPLMKTTCKIGFLRVKSCPKVGRWKSAHRMNERKSFLKRKRKNSVSIGELSEEDVSKDSDSQGDSNKDANSGVVKESVMDSKEVVEEYVWVRDRTIWYFKGWAKCVCFFFYIFQFLQCSGSFNKRNSLPLNIYSEFL